MALVRATSSGGYLVSTDTSKQAENTQSCIASHAACVEESCEPPNPRGKPSPSHNLPPLRQKPPAPREYPPYTRFTKTNKNTGEPPCSVFSVMLFGTRSTVAHTSYCFFFILATSQARALEVPPCASPDLVILDQAIADSLISVLPDPDETRYELEFASLAPELTTLPVGSPLLVPPTAALPGGIQGPAAEILVGTTTTTIVILRRERWTNPRGPGLNNLIESVLPDTSDRVCEDTGVATDTDQNGMPDTGLAQGACERDSGGEFGFQLEIADGVFVNGMLSVSPFDIRSSLEFEEDALTSASFTNTGRVSFSGELSATVDAVLNDNRPVSIGGFPVATHTVVVPEIGTLQIDIDAEVYAGACGNVSAGMRAGLTSTGIARVGLAINGEASPQVIADLGDSTIDASPPQLAGDAPVDVTLYGGVVLRTNVQLTGAGVLPLGGADLDLVARGSVRTLVDPNGDPWWEISGRPEVYVDLSPELLTVDLTNYSFNVINPPPTTFFTSDAEFPFTPPGVARGAAAGTRESGTALRWSRAFLTDDDFTLQAVAPASDGGALILGQGATGALVRINFRGDRVWQRQVGGGVSIMDTRQLSDGRFLIAGVQGSDLSLLLIDDSGALIWSRVLNTDDGFVQSSHITGVDNGVITLGGQYVITVNTDELAPWAVSLTNGGTINWFRRYGLPGIDEEINAAIGLADGGVLLAGKTDETPPGPMLAGSNAYTLRIAADGSVAWSHVWASSTFERLLSARQAPDGSFLVGDQTGGTNLDTAPRGLMIRFDEDSGGAPTVARWIRAISGSRITSETPFAKYPDRERSRRRHR